MILGVVGAGTMGAGIAQVALEHGDEVVLHDIDPDAIDGARDRIRDGLTRRSAKLGVGDADRTAWIDERLAGLRAAHTLDAVAAEAHLVIEAVLEDLGLKREVVRALDAAAPHDVVIATNTSALSVAAIAAVAGRPDRVLGLHFFNPVPVMSLVEVVAAASTAPDVVERAVAIVAGWDKTAVRSTDTPGFIVNRVHRPFTIEALRLLETGAGDIESIDEAVRADGFPIGPFALMDLIGIDVNLAVATAIWEGLGRPERLRPSPIQAALVAAGRMGRKNGIGFYRYDAGRLAGPAGWPPEVALPGEGEQADRAEPSVIRTRIREAIVDEARAAVAEGVATPAEIDLALRLGAGHPRPVLDQGPSHPVA